MATSPPNPAPSQEAPAPSTDDRAAGLFGTDHLQTDLRGRAVRGGAIALLAQVLHLSLLAVLARLLAVEDFGLIAKVFAVTGFITMFRNAGLGAATVQRAQVNHAQISTLFWVNLALAATVALLVAALAPLLMLLYNDPRVLAVTLALAVPTFFAGLSVQHMALLRRQMRFGRIAVIEISSLVIGMATAITAAAYGAGYWALILQQYGSTLSRVLLTLTLCPWMPGRPRRGTGVRPMLAFGGNLTGSSLCAYVTRHVDNVLIGRFVGDIALGFYSMAYRLLMLPIQTINGSLTGVAVPTLSRLQDQPQRFARYYYRAIGLITTLGMPIIGLLFVEAPAIVELVLGPGWQRSALLFRLLAPVAFVGTFNVASGWVYVALGHTDRQLRWEVVIGMPFTVASFIIGLPWGAVGVATTFSASQVLLRAPGLWYCYRGTPLTLGAFARTVARPASASIGAAAVVFALHAVMTVALPLALEVALVTAVYVLVYAALWLALPGGRAELAAYRHMVRELRSRRNEPMPASRMNGDADPQSSRMDEV